MFYVEAHDLVYWVMCLVSSCRPLVLPVNYSLLVIPITCAALVILFRFPLFSCLLSCAGSLCTDVHYYVLVLFSLNVTSESLNIIFYVVLLPRGLLF